VDSRQSTDIPGVTTPWRLFDGYHPLEGAYDEMVAAPGVLRPHCEGFVRSLEALEQHEFNSRWEGARRSIRENGVTYNIYGDPEGVDRPWQFDMMPLLIAPAEWTRLEAALIQRTRLLNLVLADLYGPQTLLGAGLLPPSLVFSNPAFLRPCHGIRVPHGIHLHLHAVDLARSPDGQWSVLADRTQAPSGAGYALENRIVLLRSLPETFRDCQVQRLASFFRAQRDTLMALAPQPRDQPRVVLLTPGPYNETYFEHAYLARYLGFTLVEGGDLTVRDCRVFIKTLEGLQPVDVIFRRLDDSFCDPLELRGDSSLGVAGLVEAARAGTVTIANALGSGVIETAAIIPFLPGLCRHLLGAELMLPSVATWWGGQPGDLRYMLEHLDQLVAKRAFPTEAREPVFGRKLNEREQSSLAAELRARPDHFVAQEQVALSAAPVWHRHRMEPRPVVFRTYVAAAGDSYAVMPGGLTRVSRAHDVPIVSMQRGGGSKDTWVLSEEAVSPVTLLAPAGSAVRLERAGSDLPSRVAESLFWLGRYAERAEHAIRLLRSVVARLTDRETTDPLELSALLHVLVALNMLPERFAEHRPLRELEEDMLAFISRENPHGGLRLTLNELRRIAAVVRDRLSIDTWRILNQLQQDLRLRHGRIQFDDVLAHLNRMITDLAAFSGMEMENMNRGHAWRFLDVGRRLERAMNAAGLVRQALSAGQSDSAVLEPLLEIADSSMTYRSRYFARPRLSPTLDLLLLDDTNSRAVAFQLSAVVEHIRHLPRDPKAPSPTREEQLIDQAMATLRQVDPHTVHRHGEDGAPRVAALLGAIEGDLRAVSETITYFYFSHAELRVS
jgi:uncharacterized circularly permuted ATP-grasp superfamily protein/uncharacterized alpha-E superfamily protein